MIGLTRMSRWRALSFGLATAMTGCSFLVSTDGLSGTVIFVVGDGGGTDAAGGAVEASGSDANADGATDAADAGPPPPFCASMKTQPVLCADFDNDALTDYGDIQGAPPTLDTTQFTSPARSMLTVVEADASNRYSKIAHAYQATPTSLQAAFSV